METKLLRNARLCGVNHVPFEHTASANRYVMWFKSIILLINGEIEEKMMKADLTHALGAKTDPETREMMLQTIRKKDTNKGGELMFVICEIIDVGGRDDIEKPVLATESVYGGALFPYFYTEEAANEFIQSRDDKFRNFKVVQLTPVKVQRRAFNQR